MSEEKNENKIENRGLPKIDLSNENERPMHAPQLRVFEYCPECGKYIAPGFRTDACPFCSADFKETKEYKRMPKSSVSKEEWKEIFEGGK